MEYTPDPKFFAVYDGVVTRRDDPLRIGRVEIRIPGMIDEPGVWALPTATVGGGSSARGFFYVPDVGAEISVWFKIGDPDHPRYVAGPWGAPDGQQEIPEAARGLSAEETPDVRVLDFKNYELVVDEREGHETFRIRDKRQFEGTEGDTDIIEFDGVNRGLVVSGMVSVNLRSLGAINIDAPYVRINGRVVLPRGGDI